jgi:hypothetical protein
VRDGVGVSLGHQVMVGVTLGVTLGELPMLGVALGVTEGSPSEKGPT